MYRHVLILGSMIAFSSLLLADTVPQNSGSKSSRWLQLVSATQQESGNEPDNHEIAKQNKKARKQQEKAEKQRRKQEEKERRKQLKKQQQQAAAERKKEAEKENREIAKQRKAQQKEEMKEAKDRGHYEAREQARNVPTPPPPQAVKDHDRDRAAQDRDDQYRRDRDRDHDRDRDRDRQNVAQAQNTPSPPPVVNNPDRDQMTHDRDDQYRHDHDQDKDRDRIARDRDDQRRDHDRDYDRDRDRQNVTGTLPPATPPPASTSQDQDRDRIARERDDRYRRDRDYDRNRMAYDRDDRRDYGRDRDRDRDYARNDYDRERRIDRHGPGGMRRAYNMASIPLASNPAPGALQAQRSVSQAIYSQLPSSNVMVLLNNNNQIVLRGSAPSPGLRSRLLQLAGAAAGGYSIVDQLASDAVSSAAGSAASAAVGGIGSLFHGSGSDNSGYYGTYSSPSSGGAVASNTYGSTSTSGSCYTSNPSFSALQPGTNGCVNVYNSQVVITGQAASQADAEAIRRVAEQFGGVNANIVNQLTVNGASVSNSSSAVSSSPMPNSSTSTTLVSPGSVVCMAADNSNQVLLTGSVASPGELGTVERTVQPILGNQRLVDQINTPTSRVANGGASGTAAPSSGAPTASASNTSPAIIQTRVQEAVHSLPRLSNVDAEVSGNQVRLSGSVPSRDDDDDAHDIAQQYAPGREIVDHLTISRGPDNTSSVQKPNP